MSVPLGPVRLRAGGSTGNSVARPPVMLAVDQGRLAVTSRGVFFYGDGQTRECLYPIIASYQFYADGMGISITGRMKPVTISVGQGRVIDFMIRYIAASTLASGMPLETLLQQIRPAITALPAE